MAKDFIINTDSLNCYGARVLTDGIDITQFERNPLLLFFHKRPFGEDRLPIGRVENLRKENGKLIGTPVFDEEDKFAAEISRKWEKNFIRMCSPGLEPIEYSTAPEHLVQGQTRATVVRSKLLEISIVDMGGNDDALQLYQNGKILTLAAGEDNEFLPLLKEQPTGAITNNKNDNQMNVELLQLLGLSQTATESEAIAALRLLKGKADRVETIELVGITTLVEDAIDKKKVAAEKKEELITLGRKIGAEDLKKTLDLMHPAMKPMNLLNPAGGNEKPDKYEKFSDIPFDKVELMRKDNRTEYIRLYKAEFGFEPKFD